MFHVNRDFLLHPPAPCPFPDTPSRDRYCFDNTYIRYNAFCRSLALRRGEDEDRSIRSRLPLILITVPDGTTRLHISYTDALDECRRQETAGNLYAAEAYAIIVDSFKRHHSAAVEVGEDEQVSEPARAETIADATKLAGNYE